MIQKIFQYTIWKINYNTIFFLKNILDYFLNLFENMFK